ncbi:hypothetical protein AJ79_00426 [Helicocarpus griseus UAMH5409]|uniref:Uncharacterized protein n=1 Tax=Helicocarpus griseus UAMH5409 TaxID=1447875 RepID=A0A2B7YB03_9EURO|nr:hypothetical protein AJ79_00426 [Helicocarpus griseus UAMH5409]
MAVQQLNEEYYQPSRGHHRHCLKPSVKRVWFYGTAPHSSITHVCETKPARTRKPGDRPLDEDGLGNADSTVNIKDWDGYDFAYEMVTVYELKRPITLKQMKDKHGFKSAPRGLVYLPRSISKSVNWKQQTLAVDQSKKIILEVIS